MKGNMSNYTGSVANLSVVEFQYGGKVAMYVQMERERGGGERERKREMERERESYTKPG